MDTALPAPKSADTPLAAKAHRYPGTRAFQDKELDRRLFTGRDAEIRELCQRIVSHRIVVLYATSGTGKSSLLKAGVFPELRARGYLPLDVRFDFAKERTLGKQLDAEVQRECARPDQGATLIDAPSDSPTFEAYFDQAEFWGTRGPMVPVLVLDQFEDVFKRHEDSAIAKQIAQAQAGLFKEIAGLITSQRDMRLVLSLREDSIGTLLAMGGEIPGLTHHSLQLLPLSTEAAVDAIKLPATKDFGEHNELYTPRFECDDAAVRALTTWLAEKSRAVIKDTARGEGGGVETFVLQIFCEHIEAHAIRETAAGRTGTFTTALFGGKGKKEAVLRDYYHGKLLRFLVSRTQEEADKLDLQQLENRWLLPRLANRFMFNPLRSWRVLNLLERDLLTSDGGRRPARRDDIMRRRKLHDWEVTWLEAKRLVRSEPFGGHNLLNLSHDQLAAAIHQMSLLRLVRRQLYMITALMVAMATIAGAAVWIKSAREATAKAVALAKEQSTLRDVADNLRKEAAAAALERADEQSGIDALATLAVAVKTLTSDDTAFFQLVDTAMSAGISIPLGYTQLFNDLDRSGGVKAEVLADRDGDHYGLLHGDKLEISSISGRDDPRKITVSKEIINGAYALGNGGQTVVAITKRSSSNTPSRIESSKQGMANQALALHVHPGDKWQPSIEVNLSSSENLHEVSLSPKAQWLVMANSERADLLCWDLKGNALPHPLDKKSTLIRYLCFPKQDDMVVALADSVTAQESESQSTLAFLKQKDSSEWLPIGLKDVRAAEFSTEGGWLAVFHGDEVSFYSRAKLEGNSLVASQTLPLTKNAPRKLSVGAPTFFANNQRMVLSSRTKNEFEDLVVVEFSYFRLGSNGEWQLEFSASTIDSDATRLLRFGTRFAEASDYLDRPTRWQFDPTGRWASTPSQIIDILGRPSQRFRYPWQDIYLTEEEVSPRVSQFRNLRPSSNLGYWLPSTSAGTPSLRLLDTSGALADWSNASTPVLRPSPRLLGSPTRKAQIAPDGACLMIWDDDSRWAGTASMKDQSAPGLGITLPEGWTVLNITASKYLLAYSESRQSLQVWDLATPEAPHAMEEIKLSADIDLQPSRDNALVNVAGDRIFIADSRSELLWQFVFTTMDWTSLPAQRVIDLPHGWILQRQPTESGDGDDPTVSTEFDATLVQASSPDKPQHLNLRSDTTVMRTTTDGRGLLIVSPETSKSTSRRRFPQLLLRYHEFTAGGGLKAPREWRLNGDAEVDDMVISLDLRWCAALESGSIPRLWDLQFPLDEPSRGLPALPIGDWGLERYYMEIIPSGDIAKRSLAIVPESHELVIQGNDKVLRIRFSEWLPGTTEEERTDRKRFAELMATLTSERDFRAAMLSGGASNETISPGKVLFERFGKEMTNESLARVTAWLMGDYSLKEHPFATRPIDDWISERLKVETLGDTQQAFEASPADPRVLRQLGKFSGKEFDTRSPIYSSEACFTFAKENSPVSEHAVIDAEWAQASPQRGKLFLDKVFQDTEYAPFKTYGKMKILQQVQEKLRSLGYYQGTPDGQFSGAAQAIIRWQNATAQPPSGVLSMHALKQLGLVGLQEQQAPSLAGRWLGTYKYSAGGGEVKFDLVIADSKGGAGFTGVYSEPHSGFGTAGPDGLMHGSVSGSVIAVEADDRVRIRFAKTYEFFEQPPVQYEGTLNPVTGKAAGSWGGRKGTFTLKRQP